MTSNLSQRINFIELKKHPNIMHDSAIYGGRVSYFKAPKMKGRVTIFPSGKLISVGTTSETVATKELELCKKFLVGIKMITEVELHFKVQNIVAVTSFDKIPDFETMIQTYGLTYDPESFPAGILKILEPYTATALIFPSGKVVISGMHSEKQIEPITRKIKEMLHSDLQSRNA